MCPLEKIHDDRSSRTCKTENPSFQTEIVLTMQQERGACVVNIENPQQSPNYLRIWNWRLHWRGHKYVTIEKNASNPLQLFQLPSLLTVTITSKQNPMIHERCWHLFVCSKKQKVRHSLGHFDSILEIFSLLVKSSSISSDANNGRWPMNTGEKISIPVIPN